MANWRDLLAKPRAVPGEQSFLPANRALRWAVIGGLTALRLAAVVIFVPYLKARGEV